MYGFPELEVGTFFGRLVCIIVGQVLELDGLGTVWLEFLVSETFPSRFETTFALGEDIPESVIDWYVVHHLFPGKCPSESNHGFFPDIFENFSLFVYELDLPGRFQMGISLVLKIGLKDNRKCAESASFLKLI